MREISAAQIAQVWQTSKEGNEEHWNPVHENGCDKGFTHGRNAGDQLFTNWLNSFFFCTDEILNGLLQRGHYNAS